MSFRRENNFYDSRRARALSFATFTTGSLGSSHGYNYGFMQNLLCDIACAIQDREDDGDGDDNNDDDEDVNSLHGPPFLSSSIFVVVALGLRSA